MPSITQQLAGRKIAEVYRNDVTLVIRCEDGFEMQVGWADENGNPTKGSPVVIFAGKRVMIHKPANLLELMRGPALGR